MPGFLLALTDPGIFAKTIKTKHLLKYLTDQFSGRLDDEEN